MLTVLLIALLSLQDVRPASAPAAFPLALPEELPAQLTVSVPCAGGALTLDLARLDLRAPDAFVRVVGPGGRTHDEPPPPARVYRGTVRGEPGSLVTASLRSDGLHARLERADGESLALVPAGGGRHRLEPAPLEEFLCGAPDAPATLATAEFQAATAAPLRPHCLREAEIAFDADFAYFQAKGSSVANVVAAIDAILAEVELFYARDVQITYRLTAYVVRTAPFYTPTSGGDLLDQFRTEWTTNQLAVPRDIAHLMTGEPGSVIEYGGLAYVGVVCNTSVHYGWSMDGANIVGHELGHNWGAGHCHDTSPCNNMCGACFYVGPETREIMLAFRDSRACLDTVPSYTVPLAPYAAPDGTSGRKDELAGATLAFDVLANDADGNCGPLLVRGFDATSAQGGTVQRAAASGGARRDELVYTAPATPFVGTDTFTYEASDGPHVTTGTVTLRAAPLELAGYWPLDEGAGTLAGDVARGGLDGTISGASWTSGVHGGALAFDGVDDGVALPALGLRSNQVTLTARVKRHGNQDSFAGLVFTRDGSSVAGLHFGSGAGLRYTWNGDPATFNWVSSLQVPDNRWTFVALVIEPERATIWTRDTQLLSAVNAVPHAPEEFDGVLWLGQDPVGGRRFDGELDDVRVYPYALSAAEIAVLSEQGGAADAPLPRDGGKLFDASAALAWNAGHAALAHDLYLGTDFAAVRAATPSSGEFLGTLAAPSFTPGGIVPGTTYFWRVDELTPAGALPGPVWQFRLARQHRWRLDETSGTSAADALGGLNGTYLGGVTLAQPGATGTLSFSASFDGTNDRIELPALDLASNRVTFTAWVRRSGDQNDWSGLVFSRAAGTTAGLNFGTANELRYHWSGGNYDWDSGLVVPDATWVFVAIVVEPERARLWLGQGGTLVSATHAVAHGPEAFSGTTLIGRDPTSSARSFRGRLDDVRVFDHALAPDELAALYLGSL